MIGGLSIALVTLALVFAFFFLTKNKAPVQNFSGKPLEDFAILDHRGDLFELYRGAKIAGSKAVVLISTGIGCPIAEKSLPKVQALAEKYGPEKVQFVFVNSNTQDERADIVKSAEEFAVKLPILLDQSQIVADALSFDRTAEAVVLETTNWQIVYRGAIDDRMNYSDDKPDAKHEYLADALDDFLAGKSVRLAKTEPLGCAISRLGWPKPITYYDHVAPILQSKCIYCHNPYGSRPQNLSTYADAKGWAAMIREVVRKHRMPLEAGDPFFQKFRYDFSLTSEETGLLVKWAEGGAQEGKPRPIPRSKEQKRPPIRTDYTLGPVTIKIPTGTSQQYVTSFLERTKRDLWITANERDFSSTSSIHHLKLVITTGPRDDLIHRLPNMEVGESDKSSVIYLPPLNSLPEYMPPGTANLIPKGSYVYLEQHLGRSGKLEELTTKVRLQLGDPKKVARLKHLFLFAPAFTVPPGTRDFHLTEERVVNEDMEIVRTFLHMHKRGQKITLSVKAPDGTEKIIFSIPRFYHNFNKQYSLLQPVLVKAGSTLRLSGVFDNSDTNPNQIDFSIPVPRGQDPDKNEMLFASIDYKSVKKSGPSRAKE